jgi:cytochrome c oxidase subunit 3
MASLAAPPKPKAPSGPPSGGGPGNGGSGGDGGGFGPRPDDAALRMQRYKMGMWVALAAVVMVFAAFTSAFIVRKGMAFDWRPVVLPSILWLNTAVLLASSVTMEKAKRETDSGLGWLTATSVLGLIFLCGQFSAWRQLRAGGLYLASNPASSFFYLLTGAHGLHILGGILALSYVVLRECSRKVWPRRRAAIEATALYWHFMDGLWIYLFLLLHMGR